jgi:hypothetical protein
MQNRHKMAVAMNQKILRTEKAMLKEEDEKKKVAEE